MHASRNFATAIENRFPLRASQITLKTKQAERKSKKQYIDLKKEVKQPTLDLSRLREKTRAIGEKDKLNFS